MTDQELARYKAIEEAAQAMVTYMQNVSGLPVSRESMAKLSSFGTALGEALLRPKGPTP